MTRSFIKPEERPEVGGPPPPEIEPIEPRKLSAAEARIGQIKRAYNDGREEQRLTKEADAIRERVHNLSKQGGAQPSKRGGSKATSKKPGRKRGRK